MTTIKGIYENGEIKLLEEAPYKGNQKVLITFIEDEDIERNISFDLSAKGLKNYFEDSGEDLYQEYLKK